MAGRLLGDDQGLRLGRDYPHLGGDPLLVEVRLLLGEALVHGLAGDLGGEMLGRPMQPGVSTMAGGGLGVNELWGLAPLNIGRPRDGDGIVVSGYPMTYPTLITTAGIIASAWHVDSMEVTPEGAPRGFTIPDMQDAYLADVAVNPGNSGGPVYRQDDGTGIGVCVAFRIAEAKAGGIPPLYNSGLSIVVPIRYLVELLGRHEDIRAPSG